MTLITQIFHSSILFWAAWVIIPIVMEIIPTICNFFILIKKKLVSRKEKTINFSPEITLIIPVYNQEHSLHRCISSIDASSYPNSRIYILVVNNMSTDRSFDIFCKCQEEFPDLTMNWVNSRQGKSKALNLGLFNSYGKYIIHIDSDGVLQRDAIRNMVTKFERNPDIDCMTGTIMTNPEMVLTDLGSDCLESWSSLNTVRRFLLAGISSRSSTIYSLCQVLFQHSDDQLS